MNHAPEEELENISITFNELSMFGFIMKPLCFPLLAHSIFTSLHLTYLLTPPPPQSLNIYLPYHSFSLSITIYPPPLELHFHQRGLRCEGGGREREEVAATAKSL